MNRIDLLKFFGIGATITPVVAGAPVVQAAAQLLAVPEVQPLVIAQEFPAGHVPEHFLERTKWNAREAIWLWMWQNENNPPFGINSGVGPLEHMLKRPPTPEEKAVAAAVMQWFGTNCGHCFIEECLKTIGYEVRYTRNERYEEIRKLIHGSVWEKPAEQVVVKGRFGRSVILRRNQPPEWRED